MHYILLMAKKQTVQTVLRRGVAFDREALKEVKDEMRAMGRGRGSFSAAVRRLILRGACKHESKAA